MVSAQRSRETLDSRAKPAGPGRWVARMSSVAVESGLFSAWVGGTPDLEARIHLSWPEVEGDAASGDFCEHIRNRAGGSWNTAFRRGGAA